MTDTHIPSKKECFAILAKNKTPSNVIEHCKTVCRVAVETADKLIAKGINVNKRLVVACALLHDIEREKKDHIEEGAKLIKSLGFPEVSEVIRKHGLYKIEDPKRQPRTYEEKIVFYADKRVKGIKVVSLVERFADLKKRYGIELTKEFEFSKKIEKELMQ